MKKNKKYNTHLILSISLLLFVFFIDKDIKISNIFMDAFYFPIRLITKERKIDYSDEMVTSKENAMHEEIEELKGLLNINKILSNYEIVNATVINRNMENFNNTFIIDKGYKDGIDINDAVVNKDGLIGKVTKLSNHTSMVKMITSSNLYDMFSVEIKLENGSAYGILSNYDYKSNSFLIEGIDELNKIKEGSLVTTTGLGEKFPNGLVVGNVVRISKDNYDLAYIVKVESSVNFDDFHYVSILKQND